jgi:Secretion system C-terminal sorting domain/Domain of unknown function (DUF5122) beta-propeller
VKTKILFLISVFVFSVPVNAQSQFQVAIGGTNHDYANCIIQTTDSGFAVAGYTYSFAAGYEDMYIVKINSSGSLQWSRTVGGTGNDIARSIVQTTDGGFAVAGETNSFGGGNANFYIVKLDSGGTLLWSKTIHLAAYDYALSIVQTTDGGYAVAGLSTPGGVFSADMLIVKLNASGNFLWSKTYGGSGDDIARSIIQTTDGGLAAAGYTNSFGSTGNDFYIVKLDTGGTLQWSRTVGGTGTGSDVVFSIIQTTDGGFALAGETQSFGAGSFDMYIVKLGAGGSLLWTRTVGGTSEDHCCSIIQTTDGGFVAAGNTISFGVSDFYAVKLDGNGTLQWSKTYGGSGVEGANSIIKTTGGGYAVAGETNSFGAGANDMYIVKIDSLGNTCGNTFSPSTISGMGGTLGIPTSNVITQSPTVTTPASTSGTGGTLTTICIVGIQPISNYIPASYELYQNYPNPFNPATKIKFDIPLSKGAGGIIVRLAVYDILGREVAILVNQQLKPGSYEVEWDASNYPSGVYFYKLITQNYSETGKMVLVK